MSTSALCSWLIKIAMIVFFAYNFPARRDETFSSVQNKVNAPEELPVNSFTSQHLISSGGAACFPFPVLITRMNFPAAPEPAIGQHKPHGFSKPVRFLPIALSISNMVLTLPRAQCH